LVAVTTTSSRASEPAGGAVVADSWAITGALAAKIMDTKTVLTDRDKEMEHINPLLLFLMR